MPELDMLKTQARAIGLEKGKNAAGWVFDGNTSKETYARFLKGIEEDDPEILESIREPGFSGEYAGDYDENDLLHELGCERMDMPTEDVDKIVSACDYAMTEGFWREIERVCHYHLDD